IFWIVDQLPGDAASSSLRSSMTTVIDDRRAELGLDRPFLTRFTEWVTGLATGDLGRTMDTGIELSELLPTPLRNSLILAALAALPALVIGIGCGVIAGTKAGRRPDRVISTFAAGVLASPEFVIAVGLLTVFSLWTGWLPAVSLLPPGASPWDRPEILVLPVFTAVLVCSGFLVRMTRAIIADHNCRAHVEAARLSGLREHHVIGRHLIPGARAPLAQGCLALVPYLVGGTIVIENVYGYPGIGTLLVNRIAARDTATVATITMALAVIIATSFVLADIISDHRPRTTQPPRAESAALPTSSLSPETDPEASDLQPSDTQPSDTQPSDTRHPDHAAPLTVEAEVNQ
ncbi:MAG: ABC transporter permease, partial [Rhodococcus sp.]|nr:ABC transporter permease [Rhodococcus sp. (in: high G+C Gram-positive bacteria)]